MTEPTPPSTVLYSEQGGIAVVTLNRPQALNSFTRQMHLDLWAALDQAEANAQSLSGIINGSSSSGSSGALSSLGSVGSTASAQAAAATGSSTTSTTGTSS